MFDSPLNTLKEQVVGVHRANCGVQLGNTLSQKCVEFFLAHEIIDLQIAVAVSTERKLVILNDGCI